MKHILAFGDSLTWGFKAGTWTRHAFEDRWPNVLAQGLDGKIRVIEEGQNGRGDRHDHLNVANAIQLSGNRVRLHVSSALKGISRCRWCGHRASG